MSSETATQIGRVKWFNTKAGYGFISYKEDENEEKDVFVHHTSIKTTDEQFRYLVQGEYVSFKVEYLDEGNKTIASEIQGVNGGQLMCETRNKFERRDVPDQGNEWLTLKRENSVRGRGRGRGRGGGYRRSHVRGNGNEKTPHNSFNE